MLPSAVRLAAAIEYWHQLGADYDQHVAGLGENVEAAWPALDPRYDLRFQRMWRDYLASAAAGFRVRQSQLWQLVLSTHGVRGGYIAPR